MSDTVQATDGWEDRLAEVLREATEDKSARQLSKELKLGPNYVSQVLKDGKADMRLSSFVKLLHQVGSAAALFVLFGIRVSDPRAKMVVEAALGVHGADNQAQALSRLRDMRTPSE